MNARPSLPISEQFRVTAKRWVDADGAARMLEETKTSVLSQRKKALGDIPDSHAEKEVKASDEWREFIGQMVEARTQANRLKVQLEFIRMQHAEQQSMEATARAERRL